MAVLTKQKISVTPGLAPTYAAAAGGGDSFVNDQADGSRTFLHVKNGGGSPITVTIDDPNSQSPAGATSWNPDLAVTVANATERMIGPLGGRFIDGNGSTAITYSGVTTVTVAVIYL
jgi:hypothetical protein